jgi:hypothetical protein
MNLFNFFRRKPADTPVATPQMNPRCHHYTLAHYGLRQLGLQDPLLYLGALGSPRAHEFLGMVMEDLSDHCAQRNEFADFGAADLKVHCLRIGVFPCAVVEMTEPLGTTEAFFTALVLLVDPAAVTPEERETLPSRYFTLEKGFSLDATPRTVFGEWTKDGTHLNYGDGPAPNLDDFLGRIEDACQERA